MTKRVLVNRLIASKCPIRDYRNYLNTRQGRMLRSSIAGCGVMRPLIVVEFGKDYSILDGMCRLLVLRALKQKTVRVEVMDMPHAALGSILFNTVSTRK